MGKEIDKSCETQILAVINPEGGGDLRMLEASVKLSFILFVQLFQSSKLSKIIWCFGC